MPKGQYFDPTATRRPKFPSAATVKKRRPHKIGSTLGVDYSLEAELLPATAVSRCDWSHTQGSALSKTMVVSKARSPAAKPRAKPRPRPKPKKKPRPRPKPKAASEGRKTGEDAAHRSTSANDGDDNAYSDDDDDGPSSILAWEDDSVAADDVSDISMQSGHRAGPEESPGAGFADVSSILQQKDEMLAASEARFRDQEAELMRLRKAVDIASRLQVRFPTADSSHNVRLDRALLMFSQITDKQTAAVP